MIIYYHAVIYSGMCILNIPIFEKYVLIHNIFCLFKNVMNNFVPILNVYNILFRNKELKMFVVQK